MIGTYQLVLRDDTLGVLLLLLPAGPVAVEIGKARDPRDGGHLTVGQVREIADLLGRPSRLAFDEALAAARGDLGRQLDQLDLDALTTTRRRVSLFVWQDERDGPRRAIDDHDQHHGLA